MGKPVVLVVLDGWGINLDGNGNAIAGAQKSVIDSLSQYYPSTSLKASGISVGLPWGEVGNSEVGHQSLGSGLVIYQNLPRISFAIKDGSFFEKEAFKEVREHVKNSKGALHIMGLASDGGVHSHIDHLMALLEFCKKEKVKEVYLHLFSDGRDVEDRSIGRYIEKIESAKVGEVATVIGRFYAMDRGNNWDRTKIAYDALIKGEGEKVKNIKDGIEKQYSEEVGDENLKPVCLSKKEEAVGRIKEGDGVIFFNYREDRARQITKALALPTLTKFERGEQVKDLEVVTMMEYEESLPVTVVFSPEHIMNPLPKVIAEAGLKQVQIAETEKYAHVTYFFGGGIEDELAGEKRILVPSSPVTSYAEKPEMSAQEVTDKLIEELGNDDYAFAIVNYANPDMLGHTGDLQAGIKAVEKTDECLGKLVEAVLAKGGELLITADHGNCEMMIDPQTGRTTKEHTNFPVPLWYVTPDNKRERNQEEMQLAIMQPTGILADIAPTIIEILGLEKPEEMTGYSLLANLRD